MYIALFFCPHTTDIGNILYTENTVSKVSGKVFHKPIFDRDWQLFGNRPAIKLRTVRNAEIYFEMCPTIAIPCKVATAVEVTYMDCSTVAGCTAIPHSKSFSNHVSFNVIILLLLLDSFSYSVCCGTGGQAAVSW